MTESDQQQYVDKHLFKCATDDMLSMRQPYFRSILFKLTEDRYVLIFNFHHIIFDGSSWNLFKRELCEYYNNAQKAQLARTEYQYKDYVNYEKNEISTTQNDAFAEFLTKHNILASKTNHDKKPRPVRVNAYTNNANLISLVASISNVQRISPFSIYYTAFYLSLIELNMKNENIRLILTNRHHTKFRNTIGLFLKSLPCKLLPVNYNDTSSMLKESHQYFSNLMEFQDLSIEQVTPNYSANIMFVFQNTDTTNLSLSNIDVTDYEIKESVSVQDLEFHIWPRVSHIKIIYNPQIYDDKFCDLLYQHFYGNILQFNKSMNTDPLSQENCHAIQ